MEITPRQKRVFKKWWRGIGADERRRIYGCFLQMSGADVTLNFSGLTAKEIRQRKRKAVREAAKGRA